MFSSVFIALIGLFFISIEYVSHHHIKNLRSLYSFAGREYLEEEPHPLQVDYGDPVKNYMSSRLQTTGPKLNYTVLSKRALSDAGLGEGCSAIEYLGMFDSEVSAGTFDDSALCCLPNMVDPMVPIVYDESEDRVLAMCGLSEESHVIRAC